MAQSGWQADIVVEVEQLGGADGRAVEMTDGHLCSAVQWCSGAWWYEVSGRA